MRRLATITASLALAGLAWAADPTGAWSTGPAADPVGGAEKVFATRAGPAGVGAIRVDCGNGGVFFDVGGTLDDGPGTAVLIRFEHDAGVREVPFAVVAPSLAKITDPGFAATLAAREADALHVAPPMLGAARAIVFDLSGARAAFAACGLDVGALPAESAGPAVVDRQPDDDATYGIFGGVVVGVIPESEPRMFRGSELHVRQVAPVVYPAEAKAAQLGNVTCRARVNIDVAGVPERVAVENCPAAFHSATTDAVLQWRWEPPQVDGVTVPAQTLLEVKFIADE